MWKSAVLCFFFLVSLGFAAPLRVLFIGNSHTEANNVPQLVADLARSAEQARPLEFTAITPGGFTLQSHWEAGKALRLIREQKWDYVVLQEQSSRVVLEKPYYHYYARLFDQEIRKTGAKTVLFMGWARRDEVTKNYKSSDWINSTMELAGLTGAVVSPIGYAWALAEYRQRGLVLYNPDGNHANLDGSYLAACVLYATLYNQKPFALVGTINQPRVDFFFQVAWDAVTELNKVYKPQY